MTIEQPATVLALLDEDPTVRVYQYTHAQTGRTLYAAFPGGQWDDMREAPTVLAYTLLFEAGQPTVAGSMWRRAHQEALVRAVQEEERA